MTSSAGIRATIDAMTAIDAATTVPAARTATARWIRNPLLDLAIAFGWIPVFALARAWAGDADRLAALTGVVLLVSFCHQPVTLPLVYGDVRERKRRGLFLVVAPVVAVAAVYAGLTISLAVVAVVSALWNAHHTLRQRYGLIRVYGRKVGQDDGRYEQTILLSWFGVALFLALAGGGLIDRMQGLPVGFVNDEIVDLLELLQPVALAALVPTVLVAIVSTARWVALERSRETRNPAKYVYLTGAAVLFVLAPYDPVAAFLGFMAAHSIEYLIVVEQTLPKRAAPGSTLEKVASRRAGPAVFLVVYVLGILGIVAMLRGALPKTLFLSIYLSFGVLHFVYDGMIWKLRTSTVASSFSIRS